MADRYLVCAAATNIRYVNHYYHPDNAYCCKVFLADLQFADEQGKLYIEDRNILVYVNYHTKEAKILKYPENLVDGNNCDDETWEYWSKKCEQYPAPDFLVYNEDEFSQFFAGNL